MAGKSIEVEHINSVAKNEKQIFPLLQIVFLINLTPPPIRIHLTN